MSFLAALRTPGAKKESQSAAPTQSISTDDYSNANISGFAVKTKTRLLDRVLDRLVQFAGSPFVFVLTVTLLLVWVFLAIPFHSSLNWQVLISDVQAIVTYVFDSFLMRQQLNGYNQAILTMVELRSRSASHQRMLETIMADPEKAAKARDIAVSEKENNTLMISEFEGQLPTENWFGRLSTACARVLGHLVTVSLYWVGIFVWIGFGHYCGWSNMWQLYINSATSALMLFVFSFLANIHERHGEYEQKALDAIYQVDSALELKLRLITGDTIPNPTVVIAPPKVNPLQRAIDYYAEVVGTLVGIGLLLIVVIVWIVIGPAMSFDSNWWLIIGTYAGLIGMNDGFVLRNIQAQMRKHQDTEFQTVDADEARLFSTIALPLPERAPVKPVTITHRISSIMNTLCAHEMTVLLGWLVIAGLVIGASVMKWNMTGQLLCNVPPSLIETFFMIILITGHNLADVRQRLDLQNTYQRRLDLFVFVKRLEMGIACTEYASE